MDKQREQEKESIGKKMVELMKVREKRKAKEKQLEQEIEKQ
jgi:hypothetical protein